MQATSSSSPIFWRRGLNIASSAWATPAASSSGTSWPLCSRRTFWIAASRPFWAGTRCSSGSFAKLASIPALSFSKMRGTAKNQVGRTAASESPILRGSGQIVTLTPLITGR